MATEKVEEYFMYYKASVFYKQNIPVLSLSVDRATVVKEKSTFWVGVQTCISECTTDCTDSLSKQNKAVIDIKKGNETKTVKIKKCNKLQRKALAGLCSCDALGGEGHECCEFCRGKCVDSLTWMTTNRNCEGCTCKEIKQRGLMKKCCRRDWSGIGFDGKKYSCCKMCCASCCK